MIHLQFSQADAQIRNWQERLDNLIVAYKAEEAPGLVQPVLIEGKRKYVGAEAIEIFLRELEEEVRDWRTPRCGV